MNQEHQPVWTPMRLGVDLAVPLRRAPARCVVTFKPFDWIPLEERKVYLERGVRLIEFDTVTVLVMLPSGLELTFPRDAIESIVFD